jgi:hypothetical protein
MVTKSSIRVNEGAPLLAGFRTAGYLFGLEGKCW